MESLTGGIRDKIFDFRVTDFSLIFHEMEIETASEIWNNFYTRFEFVITKENHENRKICMNTSARTDSRILS